MSRVLVAYTICYYGHMNTEPEGGENHLDTLVHRTIDQAVVDRARGRKVIEATDRVLLGIAREFLGLSPPDAFDANAFFARVQRDPRYLRGEYIFEPSGTEQDRAEPSLAAKVRGSALCSERDRAAALVHMERFAAVVTGLDRSVLKPKVIKAAFCESLGREPTIPELRAWGEFVKVDGRFEMRHGCIWVMGHTALRSGLPPKPDAELEERLRSALGPGNRTSGRRRNPRKRR